MITPDDNIRSYDNLSLMLIPQEQNKMTKTMRWMWLKHIETCNVVNWKDRTPNQKACQLCTVKFTNLKEKHGNNNLSWAKEMRLIKVWRV